ncbi:hypothetical protein FHETE_2607 [Fusarium heterosporum]|uniref:Transcription factor domain-containing protein n=1 Tax=Fusarium heterosporum TaxID=42747 RepID=A0A8H5TRK4_FUSHE|nr:hypothetical protein FHETE_2607 [Fusarium heterosporum]
MDDIHTMSHEWSDPPSIPSEPSGMATSTMYTPVPDTATSSWHCPPTLPTGSPFGGNLSNVYTMTDDLWMPWNPLMTTSSFPWFSEGLDIPLEVPELSDLVDPQIDIHDTAPAISTQERLSPLARNESSAHRDPTKHYLNPINICSSYTQPSLSFPEPLDICLQEAGAEVFGHIHDIPRQAVEGLNKFHKTQQLDGTPVAISQNLLHAFVELYFEYFDTQFPFLHPSRLEDPDLPWILLLATAAVGSHYSEIQGAGKYNLALCDLLVRAIEQAVSDTPTGPTTSTNFSSPGLT